MANCPQPLTSTPSIFSLSNLQAKSPENVWSEQHVLQPPHLKEQNIFGNIAGMTVPWFFTAPFAAFAHIYTFISRDKIEQHLTMSGLHP